MDRLFIMPRHETSLYVYWVISDQRKQMVETHFKTNWNSLPKILRLYDISCIEFNGHNANHYTDILINNDTNNWIIHEISDNCNYCIDFGTTTLDGRFVTLIRSNTEITPPRESYGEGYQLSRQKFQIEPRSIRAEPEWHKQFTGYSLAEVRTS